MNIFLSLVEVDLALSSKSVDGSVDVVDLKPKVKLTQLFGKIDEN
jgi:hypothetical protein